MNCKEQTKAIGIDKLNEKDVLMLKLKIQRLEEEDFFVSISGKGLITHLKEKIVTFLKTAGVAGVAEEDAVAVTSLRLIYKGMVLIDAKSIEFYKIQNDDTIQLCPFRRKKQRQPTSAPPRSVSSAGGGAAGAQEQVPGLGGLGRETNQFTFISFSMSETPVDLLGRHASHIRSRGRGVDGPDNHNARAQAQARRARARIQRRASASSRGRPSPATISGTLRSFKLSLEETLRRVSNTNLDRRRELIPQLDALITQANTLRDDLMTDGLTQTVLPSPLFEILLLERMGAASRSNPRSSSNPRSAAREEQKQDTALPPPTPELIPFRNESINITAELLTPSLLRYPPLRVNTGAASEFPPVAAGQITPPQALRGTPMRPVNNTTAVQVERPRNANREEPREPQPQRSTRSRNIFSSFINRFNRR